MKPSLEPSSQWRPETPPPTLQHTFGLPRPPLGPRNTNHSSSLPSTPPTCRTLPAQPTTPPNRAKNPRNAPKSPYTPRKRKTPLSRRLEGVRTRLPASLSIDAIRTRLIEAFALDYTPEPWQLHAIQRILQGFDVFFQAGTGYGKSLVFEGVALFASDQQRVLLVICPLKTLEDDQASQASAKGLAAIAVNEDTTKTKDLWTQVRSYATLVYLSPEMALSASFAKLWVDPKFRRRVIALLTDEAHCIDEWGSDKFRPQYRKLENLRVYTGMEIPFAACTATCQTSTFNTVWKSLGYGHRPFWGVDVGCDRPNLFFAVQEIQNRDLPVLDVLDLFFPASIPVSARLDDIRKGLIYQDSEQGCRNTVFTLRKLLPAHLRDCVQAFSSNLSEACKKHLWDRFRSGTIRILCATDAAGMGCNVPDIERVVILHCPKSFAAVAQRWGRAGRDRKTEAICLLLVPRWVFIPMQSAVVAHAISQSQGGPKKENKADAKKREALDPSLLAFVNLRSARDRCLHSFFRHIFQPQTSINTQTSLTGNKISFEGTRSAQSGFELTWVLLDLGRKPPPSRCCTHCNPYLMEQFPPVERTDPRLFAYAADFKFPLAQSPDRPLSSASYASEASLATTSSRGSSSLPKLTEEQQESLRELLVAWQHQQWVNHGSPQLLSQAMFLPPKQLNAIVNGAGQLRYRDITVKSIRGLAALDCLDDNAVKGIADVLHRWGRMWKHTGSPPRRQRQHIEASQSVSDYMDDTPHASENVFGLPTPPASQVASRTTPLASDALNAPISTSSHYRANTTDSSPARQMKSSLPTPSQSYYRPRTTQYPTSTPSASFAPSLILSVRPPAATTKARPVRTIPRHPVEKTSPPTTVATPFRATPGQKSAYPAASTPLRMSTTPSAAPSSFPVFYNHLRPGADYSSSFNHSSNT